MSGFDNPFDPDTQLHRAGCSCGRHHSQADHEADMRNEDARVSRVVESAVMRGLFPDDQMRRNFLRAVGAGTAMAAISTLFPMGAAKALAAEKGKLEKTDLKIGFIPITCATPIIMAGPMGFYAREGLNVTLQKTAGWAVIRDKVQNKEYDASHMLSPMPLAMSLGLGSARQAVDVASIQNINGQAITLSLKHKDKLNPKDWKGMKFGLPFDYSIHNLLLRYYLAEHGLDPDKDVELRMMPPPDMVANLRAGNIDGFLGPDPVNQRAVYDEVGFIHLLSREIWDGHPCCSFAIPAEFVKQNPRTFAALYRAILKSSAMAHDPKNRPIMAEVLAPANYLNQPKAVLEQVLTGKFADGLGNVRNVPERVDFDPFPWYSMAYWIMSQMKRWGYVKGEVKYKDIAEKVYLLTDAKKYMAEVGMTPPKETMKKFKVMGKEFDPAKADAYVASFAIKKA